MNIYVGVTDNNWYNFLAESRPDEVNFWQPGRKQKFKALQSNELFLFKLHSPLNYIAGGGFYVRHSLLPVSLAWKAFGNKNGTADYPTFLQAIYKYRRTDPQIDPDPTIGCIILTAPFFFKRSDWIPVPADWSPHIVQGKTYNTSSFTGLWLMKQVQERLTQLDYDPFAGVVSENGMEGRYGSEQVIQTRLGQGAFRIIVTEAYNRRCAISGERTLPVLDAAHIKPFSQQGPNLPSNGLLLRQDLHTLLDRGYITITNDFNIEVSKRIKEDYGNGRDYYTYHGRKLIELPKQVIEKPSPAFLRWHNENVFLG
jgi:putative restriction endonuclease